jgi:LPS-assembly protein
VHLLSLKVMRRTALLLALAAALCPAARGQTPAADPGAPADLSASGPISTDYVTGELVAKPDARLAGTDFLLTADEIRYNQRTQVAAASGRVVLDRLGDRLLADTVSINRGTGKFTARNIRIGRSPYFIAGESAEGDKNEVTVHNATVTYREPGAWQPTVRAKTLIWSPGHYLKLAGGNMGLGGFQPLPISHMGQDLGHDRPITDVTVGAGYRKNLGLWVDTAFNLPVTLGASVGPDLGVYTNRGVMIGPVAAYDVTSGDDTAVGYLKSGYIYDYGKRYTDILGAAVPPNRAYAEWVHNQQVTPDLSITGDINWSTDSEVIRDFHSKEFIPVQEPDNYLESVYTGPDFLASVFARFQPDSFYPVQQRLPEIRFDVLPTPLGGGILVRFNSGVAHLVEDPPLGGSHLASDRLDAFLGLSRPFTYRGIVDFTPVVGARYTEYWDTVGAAKPGGTGRALGELGFDADLKLSGIFDYENPLWHIDGLRHLMTPTLSYRYIPDADKSADWIPPIDRSTFTNYLPIMELGDMRAVDQLQAANVLRFGLNNTLQTRDKTYGSRDLLSLNLAEDFRFQRAPGQTDFSDAHADLTATVTRWLSLDLEDTVSTRRASQRALDTDVTLHEGDVWMARFGVGYLSDKYGTFYVPGLGYNPIVGVDTYHYELRGRVSELYELFTRGDYDARDHLIVDQYYGVDRKISNTWDLEIAVVFSSGPNNNQGHFGVEVGLNLLRF